MLLSSKKKELSLKISIIIGFAFIIFFIWVLINKLEGEKPALDVKIVFNALGLSQSYDLTISDEKTGIRKFWVGLIKDKKEFKIFEKDFPSAGILLGIAKGGEVHKEIFNNIIIEPTKLGITDGKVVLRFVVWDYSWRNFFKGNETVVEKEMPIDLKPPQVHILSKNHNISQGGANLIVYDVSKKCQSTGVYVGEKFFQGYSAREALNSKDPKDTNFYLAFVALNYDQMPPIEVYIKATDEAGNIAKLAVQHRVVKKIFKKDALGIGEGFIDKKLAELENDLKKEFGNLISPTSSKIDKFLIINGKMRLANEQKISELTKKTDPVIYWSGLFARLPRSASRANFADKRDYKYQGKVIDQQVHLGVDLASLEHSQIPAANNGKIVFVGSIGIYGNVVIIDHGCGIFSLYSHLSSFLVKTGQQVEKGTTIGLTGVTGLAGGDHLHFSMLVSGIFVNPIEWWDNDWLKNNIFSKIDLIKTK